MSQFGAPEARARLAAEVHAPTDRHASGWQLRRRRQFGVYELHARVAEQLAASRARLQRENHKAPSARAGQRRKDQPDSLARRHAHAQARDEPAYPVWAGHGDVHAPQGIAARPREHDIGQRPLRDDESRAAQGEQHVTARTARVCAADRDLGDRRAARRRAHADHSPASRRGAREC